MSDVLTILTCNFSWPTADFLQCSPLTAWLTDVGLVKHSLTLEAQKNECLQKEQSRHSFF